MNPDLEAVLDYCQSDEEWQSFRDSLIDNGSPRLDVADLDVLEFGNDDAVQVVLETAAADPEQHHIWAVAHRVRQEITSGSR